MDGTEGSPVPGRAVPPGRPAGRAAPSGRGGFCEVGTMGYIDIGGIEVFRGGAGASSPVIYVIDSPEHPFGLAAVAEGRGATVVRVPVRDWADSLTPWEAPGLRRGAPRFGGRAVSTFYELRGTVVPLVEERLGASRPPRRAICGYSLGGLFALFAFTGDRLFSACACLSGSLWYRGWVDYLSAAPFEGAGRYAFLSLGKKEPKAGAPIMRGVADDMSACARILEQHGCAVDCSIGPGGHMQHHRERFEEGLAALEAHL